MSSRVLKKLHGDKDLELKEAEEQLSDVDQDLGAGSKKKQLNLNRYDLVGIRCVGISIAEFSGTSGKFALINDINVTRRGLTKTNFFSVASLINKVLRRVR